MGFQLHPIFISNKNSFSNEEVLDKLGISNLKKGERIEFYKTNKKLTSIFVGDIGKYKIVCSGELVWKAFKDEAVFSEFNDCEIAVTIWNETIDSFGFCLIEKGNLIRKALATDSGIEYNIGQPIEEELKFTDVELFDQDEKEEMIEMEGMDGFKEILKSEIICRATGELSKRYLGSTIIQFNEQIDLFEYVEK